MRINKVVMVVGGITLAGVGVSANATTATSATKLTPSLTITDACTVSVANNVAFPIKSVNFIGGVVSSTIGTVLVAGNCKKYWLGADAGVTANYNAGGYVRQLASGVHRIPYTLDISGTGTQVNWGTVGMNPAPANSTTAGGQVAYHQTPATPKATTDVYTITGNATVPTNPIAGTYTDTVVVLIDF
jgi:spore coat protein U-like protein